MFSIGMLWWLSALRGWRSLSTHSPVLGAAHHGQAAQGKEQAPAFNQKFPGSFGAYNFKAWLRRFYFPRLSSLKLIDFALGCDDTQQQSGWPFEEILHPNLWKFSLG
jgi:hypothetical protein